MMNRRPDFERIRREAANVFAGAGQTALLRTFVTASAGNPRFGIADSLVYSSAIITALFAMVNHSEQDRAGGQTPQGTPMMSTDRLIRPRDEVIWLGTAYRAAGAPMPETIGGRVMWRTPLVLANVTG